MCIDVCGCCAIDDVILNDTRLTERDEHLQRIQINVGGRNHENTHDRLTEYSSPTSNQTNL